MTRLLQWMTRLTAMTLGCGAYGAAPSDSRAHAVKVTVLVTNLGGDSYEGDGEWGYSALVEVDGHKILSAVVSAVGSSFTLGQGIDPRRLAQ